MQVFVDQSGLRELEEVLTQEGVTFQVSSPGSTRESETASWQVIKVEANVPEITVPPEFRESDGGTRAFRLPSGKLILTDLEGNLDRIATPIPGKS